MRNSVVFILALKFLSVSFILPASNYVNDMDYVLGDVKQAFIQNKISSESQVENLLLGFKEMGVNGIRIPIFAEGLTPNKVMFDYFYSQATAQGFLLFANPAQCCGGQRIANGILNGTVTAVKDDTYATSSLIGRVIAFANEYKCKWINPFNEDGAPDATWSTYQMNTIYSTLYNNMNGAELIGPCVWGIPASIKVLQNTNVGNYITVAATHNLGFNHNSWPTFISSAKEKSLPVWDSEVNHNRKYENKMTRLEAALENKVDGLVLYNSWNTINLNNGSINNAGKEIMGLFLKDVSNSAPALELNSKVLLYPNPAGNFFNVCNAKGALLEIYNVQGKCELCNLVESNYQEVEINQLSPGIYVVRIINGGVISNYRIVKK